MHTITAPDGTTIAYDRTGAGEPVVLVGGAFSYRRFPGQVKLAQLLSARFTVYSYDRRGRGDSGDTAPYCIEREIEDLAAVIDAAGGHAHVWGLSSGAVPALEAAAAGLPIRRLAVHEPPFVVAFVLTMLRLMPKAWKTLTAVAPACRMTPRLCSATRKDARSRPTSERQSPCRRSLCAAQARRARPSSCMLRRPSPPRFPTPASCSAAASAILRHSTPR